MPEMSELLKYIKDENISQQEIEDAVTGIQLDDLTIPKSISVESTLVEINHITARLYELHNKQPRDPIPLNKIIALLELKTRIVGMMNIKPDVQAMVDSEINVYKRRFLDLAMLCCDKVTMDILVEKLANEGL